VHFGGAFLDQFLDGLGCEVAHEMLQ